MNPTNPLQSVRDALGLAASLAEEIVRLEAEAGDFWNGDDFYDLMESFVSSIYQLRGFEIEQGSPGSKLIDAVGRKDRPAMSRHRFEIVSNLKALSGGKRGGYMFFVFWPKLHLALAEGQ